MSFREESGHALGVEERPRRRGPSGAVWAAACAVSLALFSLGAGAGCYETSTEMQGATVPSAEGAETADPLANGTEQGGDPVADPPGPVPNVPAGGAASPVPNGTAPANANPAATANTNSAGVSPNPANGAPPNGTNGAGGQPTNSQAAVAQPAQPAGVQPPANAQVPAANSEWTDPDEDPPRLVDALLALHESRVIQNGDSILSIAAESGCSVVDFVQANPGLNPSSLLQPGARLNLPDCARRVLEGAPASGETYEVQSGDYLALIASAAGCSVTEVIRANGLVGDAVNTGDRLQIPDCSEPDGRPYTVTAEASIEDIARNNRCTVGEVVEASRLPSADVVEIGTVVYVPDDCVGEPIAAAPRGPVPVTIDHNSLASLMSDAGFRPPRRFKAQVVELVFDGPDGALISERRLDWQGTGDDFDDWNPASSVKLFSAIAAAWRVQNLGFSSRASVVFEGDEPFETTVDELIGLALIPSDNIAHNRLVQIAGFDPLHGELFTAANGFSHTALTRPYARGTWMELGESSSLRSAPPIALSEDGRSSTIPAATGRVQVPCTRAACTSLSDLAEAMKQLMLADQLPPGAAFDIADVDRLAIRRALRADRRRGNEVVDGLAAALPNAVFYHKAGFSNDWYSDTVFISIPGSDRAWIVGLAGHPGRNILDDAAQTIGRLIADGTLQGTPSGADGTQLAGATPPSANSPSTAPTAPPTREVPERCTYRSYQWDTRTNRSANRQEIDHPYSEVVDDERSPADPDCTVCSQDQVVIDPADLGISGVEPIAVCWKYADVIREALANIHASGEFEIVQLDGYRAGRTRGRTVDGLRTEWSNHSFGAAIDINREENGLYRRCDVSSVTTRALRGCSLSHGGEWDPDRNPNRTIAPGSIVYEEFTQRVGWRWGGELEGSMRDLMHFSLTGE